MWTVMYWTNRGTCGSNDYATQAEAISAFNNMSFESDVVHCCCGPDNGDGTFKTVHSFSDSTNSDINSVGIADLYNA